LAPTSSDAARRQHGSKDLAQFRLVCAEERDVPLDRNGGPRQKDAAVANHAQIAHAPAFLRRGEHPHDPFPARWLADPKTDRGKQLSSVDHGSRR
jgi:hypothetical protein